MFRCRVQRVKVTMLNSNTDTSCYSMVDDVGNLPSTPNGEKLGLAASAGMKQTVWNRMF